MPDVVVLITMLATGSLEPVGSADALVATRIRYVVAPVTDNQLNVGVMDTFVLPLVGLDKLGAGSAGTVVVKLRDADQTPPAVALPARTSQ